MSSFFQGGKTRATPQGAAKVDQQRPEELPWVEKYRPKTLADVSSQDEPVKVLRNTISTQNLPHLLFYGPPGTGKTSTILALAREIYGHDLIKSRVLELNASDERGIQVVREKIKNFAQIYVSSTPGYVYPASKIPPYKLIILDEADSMTSDAQSALRRTIETYSRITRFCLICNYVSRIIEPLASRCAKFRFLPLNTSTTLDRLSYVAKEEGLSYSDETLQCLVDVGGGDLRKAMTYLQSASKIQGSKGTITPDIIKAIAGFIPSSIIDNLFTAIREVHSYEDTRALVIEIIHEGYSANQLLQQMHDQAIQDPYLTEQQKALMALVMGEIDARLVEGADEELQVMDLVLRSQSILRSTS
ncbi:MAG: replication factor C subunit 2 [Piptocephalis tieghemiana]|nr:MAG: replication factor C subunit 2 [Piptocephalis tieghemiana]